jgi:hypothetical protein
MASSFGSFDFPASYLPGRRIRGRDRPQGGPAVSTTAIPDRFTTLPDEHALQATVVALEEHGFSVEVVSDLDAARQAVLARISESSSVMTNASVTLARADLYPQPAGRRPRAAAYGQHSQVGKILEIHTELPGRIHVVLIRQQVGY